MSTAQEIATPSMRSPLNYGWVVVAILFVAQMLVIGITSYGFALLVKPIAAEYGLPRADVNIGLMLLLVGMAVSSPFIGRMLDRVPSRFVIALGALIFGAGALTVALTTSLWAMGAATLLLLSTGTAMLGPLTASTLTSRWFEKGRGKALGVVSVATSAGGFLVLPLMAALVEQFGWRTALITLGLLVSLLLGGLGLLFMREPDDAAAAHGRPRSQTAPRWTARMLCRTRDFWLIAISIGLLFGIDQALLASLVAYGTDRGFSLPAAAMLVSAISGSAILGKLAIGALADRIDLRWLLIALALLTEIFLGVLLIQPSYEVLMMASLVVGAAVGGSSPLWAAFVAIRFGVASYGSVMGLMALIQIPLTLGALRYIGHVYDSTHSYGSAFHMFAVAALIAALAILPVKTEKSA
ncbi:MFS transporter [Sphingobium estronivorans]|uniref:MFS transporter n=1 Tax=Sphingobium estronivorans TaxID=1577690 RepID=UPI0013C345F7|nr:MFS transporter [Sphingobium estronivorans]